MAMKEIDNAEEARRLERRSNIVQYGASHPMGVQGGHKHRDDSTPRCADHANAVELQMVEEGHRILKLVAGGVGGGVWRILRTAAATIVERHDPAGLVQRFGEGFEIGRVAGQSRQTEEGRQLRVGRTAVAGEQRQLVGADKSKFPPAAV